MSYLAVVPGLSTLRGCFKKLSGACMITRVVRRLKREGPIGIVFAALFNYGNDFKWSRFFLNEFISANDWR